VARADVVWDETMYQTAVTYVIAAGAGLTCVALILYAISAGRRQLK
jgi:hypothetical protein